MSDAIPSWETLDAIWRLCIIENQMWISEQWFWWQKERKRRLGGALNVPEVVPEDMEIHLATQWRREALRNLDKQLKEQDARRTLVDDMQAAAELPREPPAALERKALNKLDKRAKGKAHNDENNNRQHRYHSHCIEKKQAEKLVRAQAKKRTQNRARDRANKLVA